MNIIDLLPKRFANPILLTVVLSTKSQAHFLEKGGVYAIMQDDEVTYVGYTTNLRGRFEGHRRLASEQIYFGKVYFWADLPPADESVAIVCLRPKLNKQLSRNMRGFEGKDFWDEVVTVMKQHSNK